MHSHRFEARYSLCLALLYPDLSPYEAEDMDMSDFEVPVPVGRRKSAGNKHNGSLVSKASQKSAPEHEDGDYDEEEMGQDEDEDEDMEVDPIEDVAPVVGTAKTKKGAKTVPGSGTGTPGTQNKSTEPNTSSALLAALAAETGLASSSLRDPFFGGLYGFRAGVGAGGVAAKWRDMIKNLKSPASKVRLAALEAAAMELAMSMEEMLAGRFPTELAVTEFVAILQGKPNIEGRETDVKPTIVNEDVGQDAFGDDPDLRAAIAMSRGENGVDGLHTDEDEEDVQAQLLACRCLANLMEVLPGSINSIIHQGAIPVLCAKLQNIGFIELGEQVISVSAPYAEFWFQAGVLTQCLLIFSDP